ncbi:MAG: LuxR family transcriptional regulator [Rhodospirillales bacterium]|nr:LuxR family transcriptional regulator [Rhodospirillales bacterium]
MTHIERLSAIAPAGLTDRGDGSGATLLPPSRAHLSAAGNTDLLEFIEFCQRATTSEAAFEVFRTAAERLGYDRIALVPVTPQARQTLGVATVAPAVIANVPEDWIKHYFANGYELCDPVLLRMPNAGDPLIWDDLPRELPLSPKQRRVMIESRDAGLLNGVSIPLHGPRGETYVVSLATAGAKPPVLDDLAKLQIIAVQFMLTYARLLRHGLGPPASVRLTDRERECLTWTARGKSAWSIGKILNVSEHTVNFHLKRAMAKLAAANRMQAVVAALRLGLILP